MKEEHVHFYEGLIKECVIKQKKDPLAPFALVIFGGLGDLSKRKLLPTLFYLFRNGHLDCDFSVLIVGHKDRTDIESLSICKDAIKTATGDGFSSDKWDAFATLLHFVNGEFEEVGTYTRIVESLDKIVPNKAGCTRKIVFYLAVLPENVPSIVGNLDKKKSFMNQCDVKLIVEKPLGHDYQSAEIFNNEIASVFDESQVFRIDHYLGKETVQNIMFFRFSNTIFEPVWNRTHIDHVQITVSENMGINNRSKYFDTAGIVRDFVQNHILQLIALIAMEPHLAFDSDAMRQEKLKVYKAIRPFTGIDLKENIVLGQYSEGIVEGNKVPGYCEESGIRTTSSTPTFFAGKFHVENWRWEGVPFYVRVGKRLEKNMTRISVHFKKAPVRFFGSECKGLRGNVLLFDIQPEEKISMEFGVKYPGADNQAVPAFMNFDYGKIFGKVMMPPYARLLVDCIRGDVSLFEKREGVQEMWRIVDPIVEAYETAGRLEIFQYAAGSWGPKAATDLIVKDGRQWYDEGVGTKNG